MPQPHGPVTIGRITRTWWPLAASWLFMSLEAPLLTAAVARLPGPLVNLAAYGGVVFPLSLLIEAPIIMLLAASTALSRDMASYRLVRRYMMWAGGLLTLLHVAVALTPLYYVVVVGLMGADPAIVEPARLGLILMTPWTWSIAYRRFNQGVLIRYGRSRTVGIGTVVRLSTVIVVLAVGYTQRWPGIAVAASAVACGVMAEALYTRFAVQPVLRGPLAASPAVAPALTWPAFYAFYTPLVLTSLLMLAAQPIGSAAMSRMPQAVASLAAWQVVGAVLFMIRSPGVAFNEVVVALADEPGGTTALRRFALGLAAATSLVLLVFLVTPLGDWWFRRLMDLSPELVGLAKSAMWLGIPLAALTVAQSWYQGLLVNTRRTRGVSEAVAVYLVVDGLLLALGVAVGTVAGLYVAIAAMIAAMLVQTAWLWHWARASLADLDARDGPALAPAVAEGGVTMPAQPPHPRSHGPCPSSRFWPTSAAPKPIPSRSTGPSRCARHTSRPSSWPASTPTRSRSR
jgi:hypothetical protein